jgi:hypothetical protein
MHAPHTLLARSLVLTSVVLATLLSACGGYGSNYSATGAAPGASCGGTYSVACPPPSVSLTAPTANATVSGTVTLTADATASTTYGLTIASVEFLVDGTSVGTVMSSPYTFMWDSTKVANGNHTLTAMATDSAKDTMTSAPVTVSVSNAGAAAAALSPAQIFPTPVSAASGAAHFSAPADGGALSGTVTLSGMSASAVTLHQGFAGSTGETVLALAPSAAHAGEWVVPANTTLSEAQLAALARGGLYLLASSAAHPQGEIRGQLLPDGVSVSISPLRASPEALALGLQASGVAAATLDARAATLTVHVNSSGIEDATAAQVAGVAGTRLGALERDGVDMGHFSGEFMRLSSATLADFEAGRLSVGVAAASVPEGALRGAIGPNTPARGD